MTSYNCLRTGTAWERKELLPVAVTTVSVALYIVTWSRSIITWSEENIRSFRAVNDDLDELQHNRFSGERVTSLRDGVTTSHDGVNSLRDGGTSTSDRMIMSRTRNATNHVRVASERCAGSTSRGRDSYKGSSTRNHQPGNYNHYDDKGDNDDGNYDAGSDTRSYVVIFSPCGGGVAEALSRDTVSNDVSVLLVTDRKYCQDSLVARPHPRHRMGKDDLTRKNGDKIGSDERRDRQRGNRESSGGSCGIGGGSGSADSSDTSDATVIQTIKSRKKQRGRHDTVKLRVTDVSQQKMTVNLLHPFKGRRLLELHVILGEQDITLSQATHTYLSPEMPSHVISDVTSSQAPPTNSFQDTPSHLIAYRLRSYISLLEILKTEIKERKVKMYHYLIDRWVWLGRKEVVVRKTDNINNHSESRNSRTQDKATRFANNSYNIRLDNRRYNKHTSHSCNRSGSSDNNSNNNIIRSRENETATERTVRNETTLKEVWWNKQSSGRRKDAIKMSRIVGSENGMSKEVGRNIRSVEKSWESQEVWGGHGGVDASRREGQEEGKTSRCTDTKSRDIPGVIRDGSIIGCFYAEVCEFSYDSTDMTDVSLFTFYLTSYAYSSLYNIDVTYVTKYSLA